MLADFCCSHGAVPARQEGSDAGAPRALATLSHTMYSKSGFRKSTPQQDRQLIVLIHNSKQ